MAEQGITLNKVITIAVARETAKRSQEVLDTNQQQNASISTYKKGLKKVAVPPDCCPCCGNKKHSDIKDCPAKDTTCSCGIEGHFRKYIYHDGKKRNPRSGDSKKDTGKVEEAEQETDHSISDGCFNLNDNNFSNAETKDDKRIKAIIKQLEEWCKS